jgi:hypothetical protein
VVSDAPGHSSQPSRCTSATTAEQTHRHLRRQRRGADVAFEPQRIRIRRLPLGGRTPPRGNTGPGEPSTP